MKVKPRHMKKYKPRRRRSNKDLQKQQLKDFEHLLEMDLSSFLILKEEGTTKQAQKAKEKMRSDLMKYGCELEAIGRDLGSGYPELVRDYMKSMDQIIKNSSQELDPALLNAHRMQAEKLKKKGL